MNKISAVIITFNEEKELATCLASLQDIADEIIVMDSFSTDKTAEICHAYGVKFYQQKWNGYGQQKNDAASKATNEYILSIDADESLSPVLQRSILKEKKGGLSGVYKMNRLNNFYGYDLYNGNAYPDTMKRLYNRNESKWSLRLVHETLISNRGVIVKKLIGNILHISKRTLEDHINGINKYSTLGAKVYFEEGKNWAGFKMIIGPLFTFIKGYIFRLGFLDGYGGFMMAKINAHEVFLKYSKLLLLQKNNLKQHK